MNMNVPFHQDGGWKQDDNALLVLWPEQGFPASPVSRDRCSDVAAPWNFRSSGSHF